MPTFPRPPWTIWLAVALTISGTVYQYPYWLVPSEQQPMLLATVLAIVSALSLGMIYGGRWAFVVLYLTVWILPYETYYLDIKPLLRGSLLSGGHVIVLVLITISWQYFWSRKQKAAPRGEAITP